MELSHNNIIGAVRATPRFFRFAFIGTLGFCADVAVLYAVMHLFGAGRYAARGVSFMVAVTLTWFLNRTLTFPDRRSNAQLHREWMRFVVCNSVGGAVNIASYSLYVHFGPANQFTPMLGVAIGSIAGLGVNYTLSKHLVFVAADTTDEA